MISKTNLCPFQTDCYGGGPKLLLWVQLEQLLLLVCNMHVSVVVHPEQAPDEDDLDHCTVRGLIFLGGSDCQILRLSTSLFRRQTYVLASLYLHP